MYDWLYLEALFVPEEWRGKGIGSELVRRAQAVATERGCVGLWVDTFDFQARGFYEKHGFEIFGVIEDHPRASWRFFLCKLLPKTG